MLGTNKGFMQVLSIVFVTLLELENQLHAVSRTQQGRQREPSVKTLCFPFSAEFWRHCVLSGGTPRFALTPEQRNEIINLNKYLISSSEY